MTNFVGGHGLSPAQVALMSSIGTAARRLNLEDPGRRAKLEQAGQIARDVFAALGIDAQGDMETIMPILATASIAVENIVDLLGRDDSPLENKDEAMPLVRNFADVVLTRSRSRPVSRWGRCPSRSRSSASGLRNERDSTRLRRSSSTAGQRIYEFLPGVRRPGHLGAHREREADAARRRT